MKHRESIYFVSLGCAKNRVNSENMLGLLNAAGYDILSGRMPADVAVVNTCGFIQSAVEETIDTLLDLCEAKKRGEFKRVFAVGCFVQRYGYKLRKEIPEVDGWLGTGQIHRIVDLISGADGGARPVLLTRPLALPDHDTPRLQSTPFYSAYLMISEGCSHRCTFCLIPGLTGPHRSRRPGSLVAEAAGMVARGVREITIVAQDTTAYGKDLAPKTCLEDLLERLIDIQGLTWLRLLYCHPHRVSDRLLDLLEEDNPLCPYLDIPFQHVHKGILSAMGREVGGETPRALIERIRSRTSRLALRTSVMVGFPGETEEAFEELRDFIRWAAFDHLGTFVFSPESGTAAARLTNTIAPSVAEERRGVLMGLQAAISKKKNLAAVNRTLPVLVEGLSEETDLLLEGRTSRMAPEVDGKVLITRGRTAVGEIVPVRITEAHTYDLVGEIVDPYSR